MEYFRQNRSINQGIAGQISDINHQNTLGGVLDEAAAKGDFFTAKNAEQDKFHSFVKSRVDAGYYDTLESEIIDPIKNMPDEEFGEAFGYKNMSKQELSDRKSKTIQEARQSIKDTVDAINFVDSRMSFNLGTEEGRLRRNLNVYSIATSKAVGKRIEQLNEIITNATAGRVDYKHDDESYIKAEEVLRNRITKLEESKSGKSESEIAQIDSKIKATQDLIDETNNEREASREAAKMVEGGFKAPTMAIPAKGFAEEILKRYKPKDNSVEELELKEKLESALQDLPKLLRRKEEALELYAVAKDEKAFNRMFGTERIQELIEKRMNEAAEKIAQSQNEEHAEAETLIDDGNDPEVVAKKTGAEKTATAKYKYVRDQKILRAVQIRESAALEHINKIESLINEMRNIEIESEYVVIVDGVRHSMNYKKGKLDSISEINNPRIKIRNPKILNRIKSKILNNSLITSEVSDGEYEQLKDENPDLKLIEEIYERLITDKIAQSMYNLYEKKDLRQKDIDTLFY